MRSKMLSPGTERPSRATSHWDRSRRTQAQTGSRNRFPGVEASVVMCERKKSTPSVQPGLVKSASAT